MDEACSSHETREFRAKLGLKNRREEIICET